MGLLQAILLLSIASLGLAYPFEHLTNEKEIVFDYTAVILAGTISPDEFASEFILHSKIHVQKSTNHSVLVQLTDITHQTYNGQITKGHHHHSQAAPLPEGAGCLLKPFRIQYDLSGQVLGIANEKNEKEYSRNIKRAIAGILQLDIKQLHLDGPKKHNAFVTMENTIYGRTSNAYNVLPLNDKILVQKMHEMKSSKHMYQFLTSNVEPAHCDVPYEEALAHDSQQFYYIVNRDGHQVVDYIQATGGLYFHPVKRGDGQFIYVNQTFKFTGEHPVQTPFAITTEDYTPGLRYRLIDPSEQNADLPDITGGRATIDRKKLVPVITEMLGQIIHYLDEDHIDFSQPDIKHGQLINRIVRVLKVLDDTLFEEIYNGLVGKTEEKDLKILEVYQQLLPLIGTRYSVKFAAKLVVEKKVEDKIAVHLLHAVPFYVLVPTQVLLHEYEVVINTDGLSWEVRKAAILSFATLIHKMYVFEKRLDDIEVHHHGDDNHEHGAHHVSTEFVSEELKQFFSEHKIYEKYVHDFVDKLKSSQKYEEQLLYMNALYNTKLEIIGEYLLPYVHGELARQNEGLRAQAMWAILPAVSMNEERLFQIFWPIYSDYSLRTELRIAAYHILMESHPSMTRLLNIYWHMQTEPSPELYHYHYTFLKSWARTTDPCHQSFREQIESIFRYVPKPNLHATSGFYLTDFIDPKYGFGGGMRTFYVDTRSVKQLGFNIITQHFNIPKSFFSGYIKIKGLPEDIAKNIQLNIDTNTNLFNFDDFHLFSSLSSFKDLEIEVSLLHQNQFVHIFYLNNKNIAELNTFLEAFIKPQFTLAKKSISIYYDTMTRIVFPTELGVPALVEILKPSVHHDMIDLKKDVSNKIVNIHMDNRYQIWKHSRAGVSFYNPFTDVWQGVSKYVSFDFVLPIYLDVSLNLQQKSLHLSWKRHQEHAKDLFGLRSHVTQMVFVKDDFHHDVLKKSCSSCENWIIATRGEGYRHNYTIMEFEDYNTGYHYHSGLYDCEPHFSNGSAHRLWSMISGPHFKNYQTELGRWYLTFRHFWSYFSQQPNPVHHGFLWKEVPSTVHPVSEVDFSFRINNDVTRDPENFFPAIKSNMRATFSVKNNEKALKTWDANFIFDWNAGHTTQSLKGQITRIIPGQKDFKICLEGAKKWEPEGTINGHATVGMSHSTESKCTPEETIFDISLHGEHSEEQKGVHHAYGICDRYSHFLVPDYHSVHCVAAHTTIRKLNWDIKTQNVPTELKNALSVWFDKWGKGHEVTHYDHVHDHGVQVAENNLKIEMEIPLIGNEINLAIYTPHHGHIFSGLHRPWFNVLYTDNTRFSNLFLFMHTMGLVHSYTITHDSIIKDRHLVPFTMSKEWTHLIGETPNDGVFVKLINEDVMAVKIVHGDQIFEVHPDGEHLESLKGLLNTKALADITDYYDGQWFSFMRRAPTNGAILVLHKYELVVEYDRHNVYVALPNLHGIKFVGQLFN